MPDLKDESSELKMVESFEICRKNRDALQEISPEFFTWWESRSKQRRIELIYTLSRVADLQVELDDGKKIALYNRDNPHELIEKDIDSREFFKEGVTFLFGLGLGYKTARIIKKMEPGHVLFVIEEDPQILHLAFSLHDFSEAIRQEKVVFCIPEEEYIRKIISQQGPKLLDGKISLEMENFAPKISSFYPALYKSCQRLCNTLFLSYNTFISLSDTFVINELKNLPKIVPGCCTDKFCQGDFSHIPAILVATGPSLQKNIHLLKEAQGKAIIIAVGQALRVLQAYDITPDIICSIDFGESNYLDLEDVIRDATMPLLVDSRVYPKIAFEYQGNLITPVCSEDILAQTEIDRTEKVGRGKTVAQLGLNLALAMGADPIIFTGQDLALGTTSHICGANADTKVELQGNKIFEWNSQGKMVNEAYWVDGVYGGKVLTTKVLMGYLEDFENTVKNFPDRCFIDATEGGALIRGTRIMTLREALDQYCQKDHDLPHLLEKALTPMNPDLEKLTANLESVNLLIRRILRINKKLEKPVNILKKIMPAAEEESFSDSRKKRFEELSQRISCGFEQIARAINSHRIIRSALGKVRHVLMQRENKYQTGKSLYEKAKITARRYGLAYKGFETTIRLIKGVMDEILPPIREYSTLMKARQAGSREQEPDFHFRMGMCLKKMGYLRRAIPELEQARLTGHRSEETLRQLAEIHLTLEQFDEAQECLMKLHCGSSDLTTNPQDEERIQHKIRARKEKCLEKYLTKARERSSEGDFVNAIVYSRKVLAIDPESVPAREILEKSLEQRRQKISSTQEDIRQFKEESERRQDLADHLTEGKRLVLANDFDAAIRVYQEILAAHDDHPEIHFGLSRAYRGQKEWEAARKELQWLAEHYPNKAQVHADLGDVYLSEAKYCESFQAYRKAIEADKNFAHLYLKMASICTHRGNLEEAITHYENYLNLNPGDYHSLVKLGDCYLLLGAREAAKVGYQAALRIQPNYSPAMERINRLSL